MPAGFVGRLEQVECVAAPFAVEEVRARGALADELEVDVGAVPFHVREDAAEAVTFVERRVCLDLDLGSERKQADEHALRLGGVALVLVGLRGVELDEANVAAVREDDCVAVEDASDCCGGGGASVHSAAGEREDEQRDGDESPQTHVHESGSRPRPRQVAVSA